MTHAAIWAYSYNETMQPFRYLVKQNSKFKWNETLKKLFPESNQILIGPFKDLFDVMMIGRSFTGSTFTHCAEITKQKVNP